LEAEVSITLDIYIINLQMVQTLINQSQWVKFSPDETLMTFADICQRELWPTIFFLSLILGVFCISHSVSGRSKFPGVPDGCTEPNPVLCSSRVASGMYLAQCEPKGRMNLLGKQE